MKRLKIMCREGMYGNLEREERKLHVKSCDWTLENCV